MPDIDIAVSLLLFVLIYFVYDIHVVYQILNILSQIYSLTIAKEVVPLPSDDKFELFLP